MKRFFSKLFSKGKKESERKAPVPVIQVSLSAKRTLWPDSPDFKFLDQWNRPTLIRLTLDRASGEYRSDLNCLIFAAMMTISHAENHFWWNFALERAYVLEHLASKKILFRVWPSANFLDPYSAEFFDAVAFAAASGQPIEISCKWAD